MKIITLYQGYLVVFMLVFLRFTPWLVLNSIPINRYIPIRVKVVFSGVISVLIASVVIPDLSEKEINYFSDVTSVALVKIALLELLTGFSIALIFYMISFFISITGKMWDYPHGFATLNAFNPGQNELISIYSKVFLVMFVFVFFKLNLHHDVLLIFIHSISEIPLGMGGFFIGLDDYLYLIGRMSFFAFVLSFPIFVALFAFDLMSAYMVKAHPGFNIYFISLPVRVFLGLLVFYYSFPFLINSFEEIYASFFLGIFDV